MSARRDLLGAISFNDAANAGSAPEELVDAYRAEVLLAAVQTAEGLRRYELGLSRSDSRKQSAENTGITRVANALLSMATEEPVDRG